MSESADRLGGYKLLETGALVVFDVVDTQVESSPAGDMAFVRIDLRLGEALEDGERSTDHEWGALGFIFCLAVLSFHDARPRGVSDRDFVEKDELTVADLLDCLRYERSELRFSADYIRGRCVKTDITVRGDGTATLETRNRGEVTTRGLQRLGGKKLMDAVPPAGSPDEDSEFMRAVVIITEETEKGTDRSPQEYAHQLLVLSGQDCASISFVQLHERICDALRGKGPRVVAQSWTADGGVQLILSDGCVLDSRKR